MPDTPKVIKVTVSTGVKGQPITFRNRTTGEVEHTTLFDTNKAAFDIRNFPNGYTTGDIIDVIVSGEKIGFNQVTTAGDRPQSVTITTASIGTTHTRGI